MLLYNVCYVINEFLSLNLILIVPIATAPDDILKYFYLADNSHEMSNLIFSEKKFAWHFNG